MPTLDDEDRVIDGSSDVPASAYWGLDNDALNVAYYSRSSLSVIKGGVVESGLGVIGAALGSLGQVNVDGAGSKWVSTDNFYVGMGGVGELTIANGGHVSSNYVMTIIGSEVDAFGRVTVSNYNSTFSNVRLYIGVNGSGELHLLAGGQASSYHTYIGTQSGSDGTVTISGLGSSWTATGQFHLGYSGYGTLTIENGGFVDVNRGTLDVASQTGSIGTLVIGGGILDNLPGTLNVNTVKFGLGEGKIVFFHGNNGYIFSPEIRGSGTVEARSGTTILAADNSGFTGKTIIGDATLVLAQSTSVGSSKIHFEKGKSGTLRLEEPIPLNEIYDWDDDDRVDLQFVDFNRGVTREWLSSTEAEVQGQTIDGNAVRIKLNLQGLLRDEHAFRLSADVDGSTLLRVVDIALPVLSGVPATAKAITTGTNVSLAGVTTADGNDDVITAKVTVTNGVILGLEAEPKASIILQGKASEINNKLAKAFFRASTDGEASVSIALSDIDGADGKAGQGTLRFMASTPGPEPLPSFTMGDDYYVGDGRPNIVHALAGNDTVYGAGGDDTLYGDDGADILFGDEGNDVLNGGAGDDYIHGGAGTDLAQYKDAWQSVKGWISKDGQLVIRGAEGTDTFEEVEQVELTDARVVFGQVDMAGAGGQAYRLYQAAFDRFADKGGLAYWTDELKDGLGSLVSVAKNFMLSEEFKAGYGQNVPDEAFITLLYRNVLHREADAQGFSYWQAELAQGGPRENVLVSFAESAENVANVNPGQNGFYALWELNI